MARLVAAMGDVSGRLAQASPTQRQKLHSSLGLRIEFTPGARTMRATLAPSDRANTGVGGPKRRVPYHPLAARCLAAVKGRPQAERRSGEAAAEATLEGRDHPPPHDWTGSGPGKARNLLALSLGSGVRWQRSRRRTVVTNFNG